MSDVILYAALKENQRLNTELLLARTAEEAGAGGTDFDVTKPTILYNCNGCWNGSAVIPESDRGVYSRYQIVGGSNFWSLYCSSLAFGFAGACGGGCSDNFDIYCCTHCACGWVGDHKCFHSSENYGCGGNIPWIFGCSSGCLTACRQGAFQWVMSLTPENLCCGSQRGFFYCSATDNNGGSVMCCIGVRNSGYGYSCCGAHPACLKSVCISTPGGSNGFACTTNVTIVGYGQVNV